MDFEDAAHHVYVRGNNKQRIFLDEQDYETYLSRLSAFAKETGMTLLACCPMPNHSHLVPRTGESPLAVFMQKVNGSYTRLFNDRWNRVGHVLQGRYEARRCKTDLELKIAIRYVHLNPVKDGLVQRPEDWPWSSHRGILAGHDRIVDVPAVLDLFNGLDNYLEFLAAPLKKDERRPLSEIVGTGLEKIRGTERNRHVAGLRRAFLRAAKAEGYRTSDIARFVGRTPSAICQWLKDDP